MLSHALHFLCHADRSSASLRTGIVGTKIGPFDLGGPLYKSIGVIAILGMLALIYAGVPPPNEKALPVTAITGA